MAGYCFFIRWVARVVPTTQKKRDGNAITGIPSRFIVSPNG